MQVRALLFLTTLSNALLEALTAVQEAVADLRPGTAADLPEQKGSPVAVPSHGAAGATASRASSMFAPEGELLSPCSALSQDMQCCIINC